MKKSLVSVLLILFSLTITAQSKYRFTVFANPCINWLSSDVKKVKSGSAVFGYDLGLNVDKFFAERYAISSGVSIGTLGGKLQYSEQTDFSVHGIDTTIHVKANSTVDYNLQYISVPLGVKLKTNEIGYFTYFANLGLTTQMNIKATASSNDSPTSLDNDNISDEISLFNLGYHFGLGAEYSLGANTSVVFGFTYSSGFNDVTKSKSDVITTNSFAFRLGMLF